MSKAVSNTKPVAKRTPKTKPGAAASAGAVARVSPRTATLSKAVGSARVGDKTAAQGASVRAKTLRLIPEFEEGLALLRRTLGKPVNKMVNEAVGEYIEKRTTEIETDLTGVLEQIKAYRRADPHFGHDLDGFVKAEAAQGSADPLEGVVYDVEPPSAEAKVVKPGPVLSMVREKLRG